MLMSKFPKINFYRISDETGIVNIHIANYWLKKNGVKQYNFLTKPQKDSLIRFLKNYKSGLDFRIYVDEMDSPPEPQNDFSKDNASVYYCNRYKLTRIEHPTLSNKIFVSSQNVRGR